MPGLNRRTCGGVSYPPNSREVEGADQLRHRRLRYSLRCGRSGSICGRARESRADQQARAVITPTMRLLPVETSFTLKGLRRLTRAEIPRDRRSYRGPTQDARSFAAQAGGMREPVLLGATYGHGQVPGYSPSRNRQAVMRSGGMHRPGASATTGLLPRRRRERASSALCPHGEWWRRGSWITVASSPRS